MKELKLRGELTHAILDLLFKEIEETFCELLPDTIGGKSFRFRPSSGGKSFGGKSLQLPRTTWVEVTIKEIEPREGEET